MEMEWKWNGKKYDKSSGKKINGMEWKRNGNGMEKNTTNQLKKKNNGMEQKRNGNGMEKFDEL